jgi:hypothetical protein
MYHIHVSKCNVLINEVGCCLFVLSVEILRLMEVYFALFAACA